MTEDNKYNSEDNQDNTYEDSQPELYEHHRIVVDKGQGLIRIDKYLTNLLGGVSRTRFQNAADFGFITVNGDTVKSSYRVKPLDEIVISLETPPSDYTIVPQDIPLSVVFEDDDIMVVNKTPDMVVHPGVGNLDGTLLNAIAWYLKDNPKFDVNNPRVGLVHRIDKDTSGLLLVAKTPDAKRKLGVQFFNKTTRRSYNALVWGHFAEDEGRIEGNIGRDPRDRLRMKVFDPVSGIGKPAVTHYRVLERFGYVTLIECMLETGRTHQIRAHLRHIGHPLFADERYGGTEILRGNRSSTYKSFIQNCFKLCNRQALHARTLGFRHPTTGREMDFCAPLPRDMEQLIDKWRAFITGTTIDTYDN